MFAFQQEVCYVLGAKVIKIIIPSSGPGAGDTKVPQYENNATIGL